MLAAVIAICIGLMYLLDVVDSSHGFVTIILPIGVAVLCLIASSISVAIRLAAQKRE